MKRASIKTRVLLIVMIVSLVSLLVTSLVGVEFMVNIRSNTKKALVSEMELNLSNTVSSKVKMADSQLGTYVSQMKTFADFIHSVYVSPKDYVPFEIPPLSKDNDGKFVLQIAPARADVVLEDLKAECDILSSIESVLRSYTAINSDVVSGIYIGTESGQILAYDTLSGLKDGAPYDYFNSSWYSKTKKTQDVCFTDVYMDSFGKGLTISCGAPFYDAEGNFAGVIAMDILVADLYNTIVSLELEEGAYAILADSNGNMINPDLKEEKLINDAGMDKATAAQIMSGGQGVSFTKDKVYYVYAPISSTGWKYSIHVPESVVLAPTVEMSKSILIAIIVFVLLFLFTVVVVVFVSIGFANKLTKPLLSLRNDAHIISSGDLEHKAEILSNDEIGDLASAFNNMSEKLKDYIKNLTEATAKEERIASELSVATQIQESALPRIFPPFPDRPEFDLYASMKPAKEVGGDFYDFYLIDKDHLALTIADVSGKGVPGALFMMISKTLLKNQSTISMSPSEIITAVNNQLCENNEAGMFVTVWLGILDLRTGLMKACNAGHEYPAVKKANGKFELLMDKHGMVVGGMDGVKYKEYDLQLEAGDTLFVYTDGVAEATDKDNQLFGTDRIIDALNIEPTASVDKLVANMDVAIDGFVKEADQFDDITMLCFHLNSLSV